MNMNFKRKLPIPKDVKREFPLDEKMMEVKEKRDQQIADIFEGKSDKFLLIKTVSLSSGRIKFYQIFSNILNCRTYLRLGTTPFTAA